MYIKLFRDLLTSTVWMEEDHVLRVWLTFLLLSNKEGFVECPIPAIAQQARVTLDEAGDAIDRLEKPDPFSRTAKDDGVRIVRITDEKTLWHVVNREHYSAIRSEEQKRAYQREYMRDYRKRKKNELTSEENLHGLAHGDGDGAGEGDGVETHTSAFSDWWARYPRGRKIDKKKCERKFNRLSKKKQALAAGDSYQAWIDHWATIDTQFVPYPHTWLNREQWDAPPPSKKAPSGESIQVAADLAEIADSHKKSCENALYLVNAVAFDQNWPDEISGQLKTLGDVIMEAATKPAGDGYREIVEAEDYLLDIVADNYELEAKTATERRKLAREKINLPVLY